ncbi:MAG: GMC family oxidoreductase [Myxococcota bacterium]|jgi:choline dehydrogenase-like flavoprotein|nr:GMC family oxidoreductase [Myxococcota bacterium]
MTRIDPIDVLIVGAGASGAAIAWSLAETGMRIVCLEQGDWPNPSDYPSTQRESEILQLGPHSYNPNTRRRREDYPINVSDSPISIANYNGVGGGTVLYAGHFPRFHPSDFRTKTLDGVGDDWPLDYEKLEPFYAENDRMVGVAGLAGDPAYPPKEVQLPPVPLGRVGEKLANGFNQLGWHWWPSDSAIATRPYQGRDQCVNLGPCMSGCSQGAKSSTDLTYWPAAERAGVELRTRSRVREILVDDQDMATGVIYYDADGNENRADAEIVVLACNGIGTPRLLLNSKSAHFPAGLANRSGLVGKNLMHHPYAYVQGVFADPLDSYKGPIGCALWSQEFYETDSSRGFHRGYTLQSSRGFGPVTTALMGLGNGRVGWGSEHHETFGAYFNRVAALSAICEDLPEHHNTVTLDPELVDSDGIPAPKINYTLGENSRRMLRHGAERASDVLREAGARDIIVQSPLPNAGWHQLGTARMGVDSEDSVVNEWGRSHDVKNLFVVDGSIFVTSAGVNPTPTIQALALYIADQIKSRLANLFD